MGRLAFGIFEASKMQATSALCHMVDFGAPSFLLHRIYCNVPTFKSCMYLPKKYEHQFFCSRLNPYNTCAVNRYKGSGGNKKLPPHWIPTVGIVRKVLLTTNTTIPQTSPPWWSRSLLLRLEIYGSAQSNAGNLFQRGHPRALWLG